MSITMKVTKIILALILCGISVMSLGCAGESESETAPENQVITVQKGNLTVEVSAVGNLALSRKEELAFKRSGTVEEVLVEEGESVNEGQVLATLDTTEWEEELRALQLNLLQAEINLENAEHALEQAEEEITILVNGVAVTECSEDWEIDIKEMQVALAEARLEDAQQELQEALEQNLEVVAPFDGFITKVNVEGGDEVMKGTVAVTIADPNQFEADILVSEMDIFQVKPGGEAWVQVDALQGLRLPAEVTHISPTAVIQAGVVNYEVKVEIQSIEPVIQDQKQSTQDFPTGELPDKLKQAVEEGHITQEQAEEMMKQQQQGQGKGQGQVPSLNLEDFQLREGLTVTVSIMSAERNDVLLVPNAAIITRAGQTFVQVISPEGVETERPITCGLSDWQYTEVIEGLSEDEQIVVPQGTTTTSTTQQQKPPGGRLMPPKGIPH